MDTLKNEMGEASESRTSAPVLHKAGAPDDAAAAAPAAASNGRESIANGRFALTVLATIAFIYTLQWAKAFFIPLVLGILISYTLSPVVSWLERRRLPRVAGTSIVMLVLFGSAGLISTSVYNETQSILDELPIATYKISSAYKRINNGELSPLDKLRSAAETLKQAAIPSDGKDASGGSPALVVKSPDINLNDWLLASSLGAAAFLGQMTMVLFLVFFALLSGDTFKRKLVKVTGPSLSNKKITVQILDDINTSIQKYMLILLVTNIVLGLMIWGALVGMGLDNPGAWAVAAALLHLIPYFGSLIAATMISFAAFLQFESFSMMLLAALAILAISTVVGMVITTWMTGRMNKMNATAVFVGLLFGAWLWGVWGMLLCVPVIVVVKVIAQHIEGMQPIAELLSE